MAASSKKRQPPTPLFPIDQAAGFAELTDDDWRRTLRRADQALYQAKDRGRGVVAIAS